MSEIDTGGRAFPWCGDLNETPSINLGLTARDYFAAKALAALINHPNKDGENCGGKAVSKLAKWAYEYADAMIEAREA
jgi:hypothetical protein